MDSVILDRSIRDALSGYPVHRRLWCGGEERTGPVHGVLMRRQSAVNEREIGRASEMNKSVL